MTWQQNYLNRFYSSARGWVDGTTEFHQLCRSFVASPGSKILEIGAGPPNKTSRLLAGMGRLSGVDIDPDVMTNDSLVEAFVIEGDRYPFPDGNFDVCISNYVLEHVADPHAHLREVARVLRPAGVYLFRTPNFFYYVSLLSWLTPHWFHLLIANRARNLSATSHAPYPTCYRLNTRRTIRRIADAAGLDVVELRMVEKEPSYGMGSRLLFWPFMAYERLVNSSEMFGPLRSNIFGALRKRVGANPTPT